MIIPERPSFGKEVAQSLGRGLEQGIGDISSLSRQIALERAKRGLDIRQNLASLGMQQGQNLPVDQMQQLKGQMPMGAQAPTQPSRGMQQMLPQAQPESPLGEQETAGELPRTRRMLSSDEILNETRRRVQQAAAQGIPLDPSLVREQLTKENELLKGDIEARSKYTQLADAYLTKAYPNASDEMRASFERLAENLAFEGKTESQIKKELAAKASQFAEITRNVKQVYNRQSGLSKFKKYIEGKSLTLDQQITALQKQLKPLLDMGLYNEARGIAKEAGFGAEETERALSSLNDVALSSIKQLPDFTKQVAKERRPFAQLNPQQYETFKSNLDQVLEEDPKANLILLRMEYMKKGVDWKSFNDAAQDALRGKTLSRKQQEELALLSQPPLGLLDELLYKAGLRGK